MNKVATTPLLKFSDAKCKNCIHFWGNVAQVKGNKGRCTDPRSGYYRLIIKDDNICDYYED